jgi:hypothetical protein
MSRASSGGAEKTAFGILRVYNVSWLWHGCTETHAMYQIPFFLAPPENEQVMFETCRGP